MKVVSLLSSLFPRTTVNFAKTSSANSCKDGSPILCSKFYSLNSPLSKGPQKLEVPMIKYHCPSNLADETEGVAVIELGNLSSSFEKNRLTFTFRWSNGFYPVSEIPTWRVALFLNAVDL